MQDRNRDAEVESRCVDEVWGKRRWDELGDSLTSVHNHVCKRELWEPVGRPRELSSALRGDPEGWGRMGVDGGARWGGIDVYI